MKLIQLNIWGGKLNHQIPKFLNDERPDIVCMQEVHDMPGDSGAVFVTLDEIQEKCDFEHQFMSPTYTSNYQRRKNSFGNAILSRFPISATDTIFTVGSYSDDFDVMEDDFNVRNLQHAQIDCDGKVLHVFNHHGYLVFGSKLGNGETERQMQIILDALQGCSGSLVLAGDFNLSPQSKSIELISKKLRNLPVKHGLKSTYTQFNTNETVCDYIFVNDMVRVNDLRASDALVSDHKALIMEFEL